MSDNPTYEELKDVFNKHFSLGYLNVDVSSKLALMSFICYLTHQAKQKRPDVTTYQIIMSLSKGMGLPESFIKGLAVMCEDLMYMATEFPTFGKTAKEIVPITKDLLKSYIPF